MDKKNRGLRLVNLEVNEAGRAYAVKTSLGCRARLELDCDNKQNPIQTRISLAVNPNGFWSCSFYVVGIKFTPKFGRSCTD